MKYQIVAGELSLDYINTLDNRPLIGQQKELLTTYQNLADWAFQAGAVDQDQQVELLKLAEANPESATATLAKALDFRECWHRIISDHLRNHPPSPEDLALFSRFLVESHTQLRLLAQDGGFTLGWPDSGSRLDSLLWPIVKSAAGLLTSEDLCHVRECESDDCRWMFLDHSKNHSRRWCDMKVCGNRVKVQRFYQRRKESSDPQP